jgi:type II secretory pathway component GspD/PulD (secretin)
MKFILAIFITGAVLLSGCTTSHPAKGFKPTYSSFDQPSDHPREEPAPKGTINFQGVEVEQVLKIYGAVSGRTVIHGTLPSVKITLENTAPVNRVEMLQLFDTVLAQNGIVMVLAGDNTVKTVPVGKAAGESPPEIPLPWRQLPESSSFMMQTVKLKHVRPSYVVPMLAPLSGLPGSIFAIDDKKLLILRDYSSHIRQELQVLEKLDRK